MPSPTILLPGQDLAPRTSPEMLNRLGNQLGEYVDDLESEYASHFRQIRHWWDWYEGVPRTSSKNFPFVGASNIIVPIIQLMSDALQSRALASLFGAGRRVWEVTTENEAFKNRVGNVRRVINWAGNGNDFDTFLSVYDWLGELFPVGSSVLAINYRRDLRRLFFGPNARRGVRSVEFNRGVSLEQVPRHLMLWDTRYGIGEAPVVVRQHMYRWSQLKFFAQEARTGRGGWIPDAIESVSGDPSHPSEGEGGGVQSQLDRLDDRMSVARDVARGEHDIREIHVDWPILRQMKLELDARMDTKVPEVPLVVHLHRRTNKVLRVVSNPYHLMGKPFFDGFFRKRSGRGHGVGVAKKLEHIQLGLTTMVNQAIDSVTRSNVIWAKTRDSRHLRGEIDPSRPIFDPTNSFQELNVGTPIQQNIAVFQLLNTVGERLIGVFDPALGRETRQGGHPSPATATLALLEQAQIASTATMKMLRHQLSHIGEAVAVLYQQFETNEDGKLQRVFGAEDAREAASIMFPTEPIPSNYLFDVTAMNETLNPDAQMRRAVLVNQVNDVYWSRVLQGVQVLESPQVGPMVKQAWVRFIMSTTNNYRRVLDAANVDDVEAFLVQLRDANDGAGREFTQGVGGLREIAAGAGGVPGAGPLGGANGGAFGGAAGPVARGGAQFLTQ